MPTIGAKVTNEELVVIAEYATQRGLTISQLIREATLHQATGAKGCAPDSERSDMERNVRSEKGGIANTRQMNLIDRLLASRRAKMSAS